jgi:hypothetical protein
MHGAGHMGGEGGRARGAQFPFARAGDTISVILIRAGKAQVPFSIACMFAWIGERDSALAWLDRA